jgi:PAS domain S-box-containing protein
MDRNDCGAGSSRTPGETVRDGTRVEEGAQVARIVIARPPGAAADAAAAVRALERLGGGASVDVVHDAASCIDRCDLGRVDVVIADEALGDACRTIVEQLRVAGPPVIVVQRGGGESAELAWYRRGAAQCLGAEAASGDALGAVVAEQLARLRALRAEDASGHRLLDLAHAHQGVIQSLNAALLVVDRKGCITFCNPPAEQILAESAAYLHGRRAWDWFPGLAGEASLLAQTLETGERFKGARSVVVHRDGTRIPVGISCAPIADARGHTAGAVAIFQDLSEATQLRSHVLQTEKMASIGQLAAGVAHEINNPMGFIHANLFQMAEYVGDLRNAWSRVEALQKAVEAGDVENVHAAAAELATAVEEAEVSYVLSDLTKAIRESQEGSERIRHIVQDLRDFSHQDTGERVLSDVNQCLDSTANIVWPMMKHLVVLEKSYADLPEVPCYPMQLKQVFMNLLVNAFQAIEERVGESGEVGTIALSTERRGEGVLVAVRDTGVGIAPEHLDRIFDPFFTTKSVGAGTGLVLSTSFNIVQRHGGALTVESTLGEGSTFHLFLPQLSPTFGEGGEAA